MSVLPGVERILTLLTGLLCLYWSYRLFTTAANKAQEPDPRTRHFLMPPAAGFALVGVGILVWMAWSWRPPVTEHHFSISRGIPRWVQQPAPAGSPQAPK